MKRNILIYPCGADNALEVYDSLKYSLHLNVYGANSKDSVADLLYKNKVISLPNIDEFEFIENLNQIIERYKIDLIFPTHDDVVYFFSKNNEKINAMIVGSQTNINEISRFKSKTYRFFKSAAFVPKVYSSLEEIKEYPAFCKPDKGHGSLGTMRLDGPSDLDNILFEENVVTEFLPGNEFTVDCFSDKNNKLLYAFPRKRHLIRNGVSYINIEPNQAIIDKCFEIAKEINENLKFKGLWFFQVKEDKSKKLKLLEICPRVATTMAFDRYKGVNLPLLTVFAYFDLDVEINIIHQNIELYRYSQTKPKYNFEFENVYIDLDDTLIIDEKVCIDALSFIYQAKNQGKRIYLITKHEKSIRETLSKHHIPESIFDEIIHLHMWDSKYRFITKSSSILIDNYYKERKEVHQKTGIPVFDVDCIKSLIF